MAAAIAGGIKAVAPGQNNHSPISPYRVNRPNNVTTGGLKYKQNNPIGKPSLEIKGVPKAVINLP